MSYFVAMENNRKFFITEHLKERLSLYVNEKYIEITKENIKKKEKTSEKKLSKNFYELLVRIKKVRTSNLLYCDLNKFDDLSFLLDLKRFYIDQYVNLENTILVFDNNLIDCTEEYFNESEFAIILTNDHINEVYGNFINELMTKNLRKDKIANCVFFLVVFVSIFYFYYMLKYY